MKLLKVINKRKDIVIGEKIELADTFLTRLKGLLGKEKLEEGQGIILAPCSAVHCLGMKFAIDVIFLNENKEVINIIENIQPGANGAKEKKAHFVLEVAMGVVGQKSIQIGDTFHW